MQVPPRKFKAGSRAQYTVRGYARTLRWGLFPREMASWAGRVARTIQVTSDRWRANHSAHPPPHLNSAQCAASVLYIIKLPVFFQPGIT